MSELKNSNAAYRNGAFALLLVMLVILIISFRNRDNAHEEALRAARARVGLGDDGSIVTVWFRERPATDDALELLDALTELKALEINYRLIEPYHVRWNNELTECQVTDKGLKVLEGLGGLEELKINLKGTDVTKEGFRAIGELTNLRTLMIHLDASDSVEDCIEQLGRLTQLQTLHLSGGGQLLSQTAEIYRNQNPNHQNDVLGHFQHARGLTRLQLDSTLATEAGLLALLPHLTSLEKLELRGLFVTDASLKALSTAASLKELYIEAGITDEGLMHLRNLPNLESLEICNNQVDRPTITDAGLKHLASLEQLKTLTVLRADVDDSARQVLAKQLSGCAISLNRAGRKIESNQATQ